MLSTCLDATYLALRPRLEQSENSRRSFRPTYPLCPPSRASPPPEGETRREPRPFGDAPFFSGE
eukprot:2163391-Pyramimonas_sp.AAC.1